MHAKYHKFMISLIILYYSYLPSIQDDIAVIPSVLGVMAVTLLKMLMRTRNRVTRSAILPGTTSGGMRKLTQDVITNSVEGR